MGCMTNLAGIREPRLKAFRGQIVSLSLVTLGSSVLAAEIQLPELARATVNAYSDAFTRGDCAAVLRLTSPVLTKRLEKDDGSKLLCDFLSEIKKEEVMESVGEVSAFHVDGRFRIATIPNARIARKPTSQPAPTTEGTYVVHSDDGGATWYVLDLGCLDVRWMKDIYPAYNGSPPIPGGSVDGNAAAPR